MAKKIVIIDDEKNIREMLKDYLSFAGYEVTGYGHPSDMLGAQAHKDCDLIVSDFLMPGTTGDTLNYLLDVETDGVLPPIIIITGYGDMERVQSWAKKSGVAAFVSKPFQPGELLKIIQQTIGQP